MRGSRPPATPSTLSGSSGQGLVYGTHRLRGPRLAFTPEASDTGPTKKKTKLIVILGIVLPVLACIIGIAAWAVTTDVLRINPRANDNEYNRFGHRGKTRTDDMQSRSDTDVDVFVLHGITPPSSAAPAAVTKSTKKISSTTSSSTVGTTASTGQTLTSPTASDILSKLISDMPPPKHPKNFIVFAPVADTENFENHRKGRRLDDKVVVQGDDLVAEASMISEDRSQELGTEKLPFNGKRRPSVDRHHSLKPGMRPPPHKKGNWKEKLNRNPHIPPPESLSDSPPNLNKRPHRGDFVTFPTNSKPPMNSISNRNGGVTQPRQNENFYQRSGFSNPHQNKKNGVQNFDKLKPGSDRYGFRNTQNFDNGQPRNPQHFDNGKPRNQQHFDSGKPVIRQHFDNGQPKNSQNFDNGQTRNPQNFDNGQPRNPQNFDSGKLRNSNKNFQPSTFQQQSPPQQFQSLSPPTFQNQDTFPEHQLESPSTNQYLKDQRPFQSLRTVGVNQQTSLQGPSQPNFPSVPQHVHSPETSPMDSEGPQYFAPPPQTFHTKVNYDQSSSNFPSSPSGASTYEKAAQSLVEPSPDGAHHHHHHHHHREPVAANSDPIGDVNYSDVPRPNDADRLGTIGIGMGPPRGITLQIGGGSGLGGLGGLIPLGTLGIVRNIASALLPRPQLGLKSKVFVGVEVGRGGGLSVGLG